MDNNTTIYLEDTIQTSDEIGTNGMHFLSQEERDYVIAANKNVVATVHRKLTRADGTELYEFLGGNATVLGGTQMIVQNTFAGITDSQLTQIPTLDQDPGLNVPPVTKIIDNSRRIFGFGVGMDGGIGKIVYPVKRHAKGYELNKLYSFQTISSDPKIDDVVENSKIYSLRSVDTLTNTALYYIKKIVPVYSSILQNGDVVPNNPTVNYTGKLDIRSKVQITLKITEDELIRWYGYKNNTTDGATMNSIILFAGRLVETVINGNTIQTYRDIIATNKINLVEIPINNMKMEFVYTLYYV